MLQMKSNRLKIDLYAYDLQLLADPTGSADPPF